MESLISYREASIEDWNDLATFRNIYSSEGFEVAKNCFAMNFENKENIKRVLFIVGRWVDIQFNRD